MLAVYKEPPNPGAYAGVPCGGMGSGGIGRGYRGDFRRWSLLPGTLLEYRLFMRLCHCITVSLLRDEVYLLLMTLSIILYREISP